MDKFTFKIPAATTWRFAGQLPHLLALLGVNAGDEVNFLQLVQRYMHTSSKVPSNIDQWQHTTVPLLATDFVARFGTEMWGDDAVHQPKYQEYTHGRVSLFFYLLLTAGRDEYMNTFHNEKCLTFVYDEGKTIPYDDMLKALRILSSYPSIAKIGSKVQGGKVTVVVYAGV